MTVAEAVYLHREIFVERQYACWQAGSGPTTVVDVGANIGMFSMFALDEWSPSRLLAIEAVPDVTEMLRANLAGHPNVTVIGTAAGAADGQANFGYYPQCTIMSGRHYDVDHDRATVIRSAQLRATHLSDVAK
jgi:FkbM family methyltransferase